LTDEFSDAQHQAIMSALFEGRKIDAIKHYREATGASLVDAKAFVEGLEARLRVENPGKFSMGSGRSGCGMGVLTMLLGLTCSTIICRWFWTL